MKRLCLSAAIILTACSAAQISAHEETPTTTAKNWEDTPQAKILARDHRDLLELVSGIYDNQEQVYFEKDLEFDAADINTRHSYHMSLTDSDLTLKIDDKVLEGKFELVAEGTVLQLGGCAITFTRAFDQFQGVGASNCTATEITWSEQGVLIKNAPIDLADGVFRRAAMFKCWVSPRKEDGEYAFYPNVVLHDQGGMAWLEGAGHDRVGIRMRNVVWPTGNNRHSRVLYAHRGEDAENAVSYAWTSPDEPRIGINLRWMQVSCTQGDETIIPGINLKTGTGN